MLSSHSDQDSICLEGKLHFPAPQASVLPQEQVYFVNSEEKQESMSILHSLEVLAKAVKACLCLQGWRSTSVWLEHLLWQPEAKRI